MSILRSLAFFVFGLVALGGCGSGGGGDKSGPEAAWTYVGTWVNAAYADGKGPPAKIFFTEHSLSFYKKDSDTVPFTAGTLSVSEDWTADGGHYFSCSADSTDGNGYMLLRVSGGNSTLEANTSETDPPTAITPTQGQYGTCTRQQ